MRRLLRGSVFPCLILISIAPCRAAGLDDDIAREDAPVDCGTMALGALLMLEGRPVAPEALLARVGPSSPEGPSLKQLRDAARVFGLSLRGVRLNDDERAIDRPMIVFLKRPRHGHFQVIRPVGHTGKLAQVIDSNTLPNVVESACYSAPEWTGIALVPDRRPGWPVRILLGLIAGTALTGVGWAGERLRRSFVGREAEKPTGTAPRAIASIWVFMNPASGPSHFPSRDDRSKADSFNHVPSLWRDGLHPRMVRKSSPPLAFIEG